MAQRTMFSVGTRNDPHPGDIDGQCGKEAVKCIAWAKNLPPLYYSGPDFVLVSAPRTRNVELIIKETAT